MSKLSLLSINAKLEKSIAQFGAEILTAGLFMAPHMRSGENLCPMAGFCSAVCNLWFSGRTVTKPVRDAMLRRAQLYNLDYDQFYRELSLDLDWLERKAIRLKKELFVRLNGSSDVDMTPFATDNPNINFYDYTKRIDFIKRKLSGDFPTNYALCYSWSERVDENLAEQYLLSGGTVSMVFDTEYHPQSGKIGELPIMHTIGETLFDVVDGDKHDLRHPRFDGKGVIVGLRFKGTRKLLDQAIRRGFVLEADMVGVTA